MPVLPSSLATALAAIIAAAPVAGCGFGAGPASQGEAELTVTRDYGAEVLHEATVADPPESETVIRLLDRETEITTRYGGGFVQSIDGIEGGVEGGRSFDWFFYLNGVESEVGAAEVQVRGGDRIWWDHRDWTAAMRVPAVVGSWPQPFEQQPAGPPVEVACAGARAPCEDARAALASAGVEAEVVDSGGASGDAPGMLVGPWSEIADERPAGLLAGEPATSGVFAQFVALGGTDTRLLARDAHGRVAATLGSGAGLVAATREGDAPPTWLITGVDPDGVARAAQALDTATLANRYAVAVTPTGDELPLPVEESG